MPLYLLLASLYYPLRLPDGQLKMLREGLEFFVVEPSSLEDLAPLPIMDALVDKPRPLRAREISQIVCLHYSSLSSFSSLKRLKRSHTVEFISASIVSASNVIPRASRNSFA